MKNLYPVRKNIVGNIDRSIKGSGVWALRPGARVATKTGRDIQRQLPPPPRIGGSGIIHIQNLGIPVPRGVRRSNIRMN